MSNPPDAALEPQSQSAAQLASQFGALCWRAGKSGAEVLLISSRETGRWVIPKGWPMKSTTPWDKPLVTKSGLMKNTVKMAMLGS